MDLNTYQKKALTTARDEGFELIHRVLGIVGEAGEIAEKVKKWQRDDKADLSKLDKEALAKELGDVMWYVATLADYLGYSLDQIGTANVEKLASRAQRGKIGGKGDDR